MGADGEGAAAGTEAAPQRAEPAGAGGPKSPPAGAASAKFPGQRNLRHEPPHPTPSPGASPRSSPPPPPGGVDLVSPGSGAPQSWYRVSPAPPPSDALSPAAPHGAGRCVGTGTSPPGPEVGGGGVGARGQRELLAPTEAQGRAAGRGRGGGARGLSHRQGGSGGARASKHGASGRARVSSPESTGRR